MDAHRVNKIWPWAYLIAAALGAVAFLAVPAWKVHWTAYLEVFGGLLLLMVCGFIAMSGVPAARWLVRGCAVLVAGWYLLNLLIVQSNAPYYGGTDWVLLSLLLGVLASAVFSFVAVGRVHPNSTLHTDARASSVLDQPPSARAGERGR